MAPNMTAKEFAKLADDQVGKPYVLGAEASPLDPNPPKFDCSELIEWLFARNGTPIGDLAAAQYDKTVAVNGEPKVGDLVFLKNNPARWNRVGHVAVLTKKLSNGDWRIIEARGRAYGVVRTTLSYWKSRSYFTGVRRFPGFSLKSEEPVTDTPKKFRVVSYNIQHPAWGGNKNYKGDGIFLRDTCRPSIAFLQEADETGRNAIRRVMGSSRWLTWPTGLVAVLWDSAQYIYGPHKHIDFGTLGARAMKVEFTAKKNNLVFTACGIKVRPSDAFPKTYSKDQIVAGKLEDVNRIIKFLKNEENVIVGGDWSTKEAIDVMLAAGYFMATPMKDTYDKVGVQVLDVIYVKGSELFIRNLFGDDGPGSVENPGKKSDHKAVVANLTLSKPTVVTN